ncbi:unnamed protein product [Mytilus coruscus]|uniref:Uncharacterized protein n=1 Tax=Mytilus coruscus TaxID=42192 RepID=A0A6J8ENS8_MYTCO|nr:unnamed protein product [Mytilus coruscus]
MTTSNTEKEVTERNESNHGSVSFTHYMVIYSVCIAGGLLVLISICYICMRRRRNRRKKQSQESNSQQNEIQNAPNQSLPSQENIARVESIYDEIDEVSLHHDDSLPMKLINSSFESISDENSGSEKECMHNEGYLNPYQPIIKESVTHNNNKYDAISTSFDDACRIENESIIFNSNANAPLEKAGHVHQYIEIIDSRSENSINDYNDGSSNHQLSKNIQYAEIVNIQHCEKREASQLNRFLSNEDKSNDSKDVSKSSYPVAIKRLTI